MSADEFALNSYRKNRAEKSKKYGKLSSQKKHKNVAKNADYSQ